ncbi:flavin reductase like domain protein [Paraburkholderia fungorum]|uniref:Flavin reductase like domain protein n=1 Tax=Paraburkholderia fungorum TaxID=134537 RepID=A0AAU8TE17_9BURK|nr:flavin reductase family protein [Paraburkholderia fungorum]AJZ58505.1 flavin reductase like domain protein [Paraburkholderia fungorum]
MKIGTQTPNLQQTGESILSPISKDEESIVEVVNPQTFRLAMRQLAGGVCVITAADDNGQRSGLVATSVVSLSLEPPLLMVAVNPSSSSWPLILKTRRFGVNLLTYTHKAVARRFSGEGGLKGEQRYEGARWQRTAEGVWLLTDALASLSCSVEQMWVYSNHAVVIGRASKIFESGTMRPVVQPLVYWQNDYHSLRPTEIE